MRNFSIFITDDDKDDFTLLKDAFDDLGEKHRFTHLHDGLELINTLMSCEKKNELPDLVILDINMPKVDGIKALEAIKSLEKVKHIPVFMHSTTSCREQIKKCYMLGASGFVTKGSLKSLINFARSINDFLKSLNPGSDKVFKISNAGYSGLNKLH